MAQLFPDTSRSKVIFASKAEEAFYTQCRQSLGKAWRVFYSCTLSVVESDQGLQDNEIDFVLYHPRLGVIVLEVKGGRIRYDAGSNNFFSVNRLGETFAIKNPFQQALVWKNRFVRVLKQAEIRVPVSYAVCFPNVSETEIPRSAGVANEVVLGRESLRDLEKSLKTLVNSSQPEKYLDFKDVGAALEKSLVGRDFCTKLYVRDYIETHELRVKDIENLHASLVTPVAGSRRLGIEGEAGTGKTMLAVQLAKYFCDQGLQVLLLSSNDLLNLVLQKEAGDKVTVRTYEELALAYGINLLSPPADFSGTAEDWIQFDAPDRLTKAVEGKAERFDVILCDEAQDVQPFWWDVIEKLLRNKTESRLYIFFDRSQGVFGSGGDNRRFIPEEVLPVPPPYFPLVNNYRTTREIATFSRAFRTGKQILQSHSARIGYVPQIVVYNDAKDCQRLLARLLTKLVKEEGLETSDITLLSARKPDAAESVIHGLSEIANLPLKFLQSTVKRVKNIFAKSEGGIAVSTVSGFKGLETNVGILINFSEYNLPLSNPIMASLAYVASTRAKHLLYIFVQKNDLKRRFFAAALKDVNTSGAVILDRSGADHELLGEVVHYNPERVGVLSIDDPSFERNSVLFFPADVELAKIGSLRQGDKLRFRPRVEGRITIACDLRIVSNS